MKRDRILAVYIDSCIEVKIEKREKEEGKC